ncbi:translocation/assembly module TamB domain-containing protein [Nibricoccus aquaticus]|nr:translocation/assembly module TamB domain-containing protein [Nibricoccus aquaticus]
MTAPKRTSRLRRFLLGAAMCVFVLLVALVTTPWWWVPAVRSLLARQGVTFARFETLGYSRFALHDVRFQNASTPVTATVARVEADTPLLWFVHATFSQPGPVLIETWQVNAHASDKKSPSPSASTIDGWPALRLQLNETLATLQRWLPEARATNGTLLYEKQKLIVASLNWLAREGRLTADGLTTHDQIAHAELRWHSDNRQLTFSATTTDQQWSASLASTDDTVTGQLHLWKQPVDFLASFPARGWIPQEASLTAARLLVPGRTVGLGEHYPTLPSTARIVWKEARFTLELNAEGQPAANQSAPPLQLALAGHGDTETLRIERFDITLPGTSARLLAPIVIDREAQIRSGASQFSLESDLEKLPGLENLRGKITGRVLVEPTSGGEPRLTAKLEASKITAPDFDLKSAVFEAEQLGTRLTIKNARLAFADGSEAELHGVWNWRERTLTGGQLEADIKPAAFARWLPPSLTFARLKISAEAQGRWPDLTHSGKIALSDLATGTPKPISASAEWTGTGPATDTLTAEIKTGDTSAVLKGRLTRTEATLDSLALTLPDAPTLTLAQPARIRWQPSLSIETLDLTGDAARLSFAWSTLQTRSARIDLAGLRSEWLRDFLPSTWPRWQLESATLEGRWPEGPFEGTTRVLGQIEIAKDKNARIELTARAQPSSLRIDRLLVSDENGSVLEARGAAPLIITPATAPFWKLDPNSNWSLTADTTPGSPFWTAQAEASGIKLRSPRLTARIEGSVKKPDARISLQADEIAFDRIRLPTLSQLDARLVLDAGRVDLEKLSLLVAGQPLSASGRTLVQADQWPAILRDPRQLWTGNAEAKLNLPLVEIAALTAFLPDAFAPTGTLQGDLTVRASGDIQGTLKLHDASTHPITPFGSFNQISGEIVFSGRQAELKSLSALASGQTIKASGSVAFPAAAPLKVDLSLAGKNLPLARQTGLLVRGDLDLKVKSTDDGLTTLSGDVNLHDSLFLRDVRSLIPKRGGGAASRPPYFSVTKAPFRDWRLALTVGGNRFITLRTPLFNGVVSGRFQLGGTLFEPIAIGQATFDEGTILLPFAALRLTSGSVRLAQADPYSPQLAINAASRSLGYDVRMELSGSASDPTLTFSSSPSLTSEQVLLMVMAGEPPRTDITSSTSDRAASIGVYLGKSLFSDFLGDPTAAERFTFSSGADVSRSGKETLEFEYMLDKRWSLVGERDEFDDYNAGIKLRILTSQKKPATDAQKP